MSKILEPVPRCTLLWSTFCTSNKKQLLTTPRSSSSALSRCSSFYFSDVSSAHCLFSNRLHYRLKWKEDGKFTQPPWASVPALSFSLGRGDLIYYSKISNVEKKVESDGKTAPGSGPISGAGSVTSEHEAKKKVSIFKRFREMYRDYWYVLVPVHVITSLGWFGGFYYLAKSGVDIVALMENIGVSEKILSSLRDSKAGYIALAYALYKIATPVRYMVTIGGTTVSIQYLKKRGIIKPMPSKEKLKEMYQEKKENLIEKHQNIAEGLKQKTEKWKESTEKFMKDRPRDGK